MKNENLLKKLYAIKDAPYNTERIDELIAEIKLEISMEPVSYRGNYIKAAAKFAKYCNKNARNYALAGAFMFPYTETEMRQGICDGYLGVCYSNPIDGLMEIEKDIKPIDFAKIIRCYSEGKTEMPLHSELKKAIKIAKADKESEDFFINPYGNKAYVVRLGNGIYVNAEMLLQAQELTEMTDHTEIEYKNNSMYSPLFLHNTVNGNQIDVILMPISPNTGDQHKPIIDLYNGNQT